MPDAPSPQEPSMTPSTRHATAIAAPLVAPLRARPVAHGDPASRVLRWAVQAWCSVAVAGQLLFAAYVLAFYGRATLAGAPQRWNQVLPHGWVPGDAAGNAVVASHLLFAVVVLVCGALQLLPWLRRHAPAVHRWSGRVFVGGAVVMAVGGIVMIATRGTVGDLSQHVATSLNGLLILLCAALAWRDALARRFDSHRRWALRLYLLVSGVWFFRIGLMAWIVLNQGPAGFDPHTFRGPALTTIAFAQTLLPLAVLELYLRVRAGGSTRARTAMAGGLGALTLLTALGIGAASMIMWLPHM
jgi:hypothetical protein